MNIPELFIIFAVALIVLGPEKLPEVARALGKLTGQARRTADQLRREFYNSAYPPINEESLGISQAKRDLRTIKDDVTQRLSNNWEQQNCEESATKEDDKA